MTRTDLIASSGWDGSEDKGRGRGKWEWQVSFERDRLTTGGGGGTIGSLYAGRANLVRLRCMGQWVRTDTRARPAPLVALPGPGRVPHQTRPLLYYSPTPATPCLTLQCILLTNRLPQSVPMTAIITFITSQPTRSLGIVHGSSGGRGSSTPHPTLC